MNTQNNSPFPEEREEIIMNFLHNQGSIRIGDVIDILNISPSTARLLLQKMQDKGMLKRTHGGAILIGEETSLRNAPVILLISATGKQS